MSFEISRRKAEIKSLRLNKHGSEHDKILAVTIGISVDIPDRYELLQLLGPKGKPLIEAFWEKDEDDLVLNCPNLEAIGIDEERNSRVKFGEQQEPRQALLKKFKFELHQAGYASLTFDCSIEEPAKPLLNLLADSMGDDLPFECVDVQMQLEMDRDEN